MERMMDYFTRTADGAKPLRDAFIFDCHGHFGTDAGFHIPGAGAGDYLAVLDRVGIDIVAVSSFSNVFPFGNDLVAKALAASPGRFVGYARVNANYSGAVAAELARCFDEFGFKGIKLHPYCDQIGIDDGRYEPAWEFASARRAPVLVHTWNSLRYSDALSDFCKPSRLESVAKKFPGAKIIIGHAGGEYDGILEAIELAKDFPNLFLDTASSRLYPGIVERMVAGVGAGRVLYGSDVPFLSPVPQVGKVVYAEVGEKEKRMILGLNAAKLFGMKAGD